MLPFGQQAGGAGAGPRPNLFSADEQRLIMTLWSIARAPLVLGAVLPLAPDDNTTLALFRPSILDVNARSCRNAPTVVLPTPSGGPNVTALYAWAASAPEGDAAFIALFNMRDVPANVSAVSGFPGGCVLDLWTGAAEPAVDDSSVLTRPLAPHAAGLWRVGAGACAA